MKLQTTLPLIALLFVSTAHAAPVEAPLVTRTAPDTLTISWTGREPVDIFLSDDPGAKPNDAKLVSKEDRDGTETVKVAAGERAYFLLKGHKSGDMVRVAERVLPLQQGSNFRDIGGYPAAEGKHVRWGLIYRSGGQPLLTDADVQQIHALKLANLVDLRSSEERVIAPTRIDAVPYQAVGYSMLTLTGGGAPKNGQGVYRNMPAMMAPQLRLIFQDLLARKGAIAYNCSAGQDRTGFVTAMILSALGVPRDTIVADYHLSTTYRRPEWEMPKIDTAAQANNPVAMFFAKYQQNPAAAKPQPLKDADGTPFLSHAFNEIDSRWGSVENYLEQEIGLTKLDLASLRAGYLE
ncbi:MULTISPECIES: tyrosine-protein phosphatase [unclassified Sphingobium]|uniref:tyrosine-protein phosphatase n=1 Tax=unclassified Sphingobium TaxID=2611147 RepID=UPI00076FEE9E|nr:MULTISPECIES: tyrosine-protein phosphatase [unclassified Sphingobium]AMK25492.1 protein tyrosine/serine phosphatase [Sphingobium sp. TKS]NML90591.1 tyrosine-protein phosphatase [Sphingobium sp. TB-6]